MLKHAFPAAAGFLILSLPLIWLGWLIWLEVEAPTTGLGADPGESIVHFLGEWALRALLAAFTISPLYQLTHWTWVLRRRRMFGVYAFAYAVLHMLAYTFFYIEFDISALLEDFSERVFITAGILALACLLPMAVTSTRGWQRRLRQRWQTLHKLVYPAVGLAILHLFWLTRDGFGEVVVYSVWFLLLLVLRIRARD